MMSAVLRKMADHKSDFQFIGIMWLTHCINTHPQPFTSIHCGHYVIVFVAFIWSTSRTVDCLSLNQNVSIFRILNPSHDVMKLPFWKKGMSTCWINLDLTHICLPTINELTSADETAAIKYWLDFPRPIHRMNFPPRVEFIKTISSINWVAANLIKVHLQECSRWCVIEEVAKSILQTLRPLEK